MLTAIVILAAAPDPDVYGRLEMRSGSYPYRIVVSASAPMPADRTVRLRLKRASLNGRKKALRVVIEPEDRVMRRGVSEHPVDFRLEPSPAGFWIDAQIDVAVGNSRWSPVGLYGYRSPAGGTDEELRRARARYLGKRVWLYGGEAHVGYGREAYSYFVGLRPLRVTRIERRRVPVPVGRDVDQVADPLVMYFAPVKGGQIGIRDEKRKLFPPYQPPTGAPTVAFLAAPNSLTLSERVSLKPPPGTLRKNPKAVERAMREFDVKRFKGKREVLWVLGPPSTQRPWRSVFAQKEWVYSVAAPFSHVLTFRNGRVASYDMDGDLP